MTTRLKIFTSLLIFTLLLSPFTQSASAADDITGHWHEKELREMVELGIMNGYGDGIFKPRANVTRGQFSAILTRALNLEPSTEGIYFKDLTERSGVLDEVLTAANAGLVIGYPDGTFKPDEHISRQHIAVLMDRALNYLQMEKKPAEVTFADKNSILPSYREPVGNTVSYGIFEGSPSDDGKRYFRPHDKAKRGDAAAATFRLLAAVQENTPAEPTEPEAPVLTYDVATASADGEHKVSKKFKTFEEAEAYMKSGNGNIVLYDGAIVRMTSGVVITIPTPASSLTYIYDSPTLKNHFTYVSADTELEYFGSTKDAVQVKVAGKLGYIKHANANLKTWNMMTGRSYYDVSNGDLRHNIYQNTKGTYVSYSTGKAPSFMAEGPKYFSWDGIEFINTNGTVAGKGYNYFQFLPARTKTSYTAEQINAYVIRTLQDLEKRYPNNATYKDASKRSKLIGIGTHLKKVEKEQGVNALMILALAQHESNYGLSTRALDFNNLFGLRVYDDNPANDHFETVAENIDELLRDFWNKNYIPPNAAYANGSVFGTKAVGMNMRYASDAYWGAKAAGHLYRIDKALGGKDLYAYQLGMTNTPGLNARTSPGTTNNFAYRINQTGMPVALLQELKFQNETWYKAVSDHAQFPEVYFSGQYINKIPVLR